MACKLKSYQQMQAMIMYPARLVQMLPSVFHDLSRITWANDICGEGEIRIGVVVAEANDSRRPAHESRPQGRYEREHGETFYNLYILIGTYV